MNSHTFFLSLNIKYFLSFFANENIWGSRLFSFSSAIPSILKLGYLATEFIYLNKFKYFIYILGKNSSSCLFDVSIIRFYFVNLYKNSESSQKINLQAFPHKWNNLCRNANGISTLVYFVPLLTDSLFCSFSGFPKGHGIYFWALRNFNYLLWFQCNHLSFDLKLFYKVNGTCVTNFCI